MALMDMNVESVNNSNKMIDDSISFILFRLIIVISLNSSFS